MKKIRKVNKIKLYCIKYQKVTDNSTNTELKNMGHIQQIGSIVILLIMVIKNLRGIDRGQLNCYPKKLSMNYVIIYSIYVIINFYGKLNNRKLINLFKI